MISMVDIHCHLLAGLDDGPRTQEDALAMCRIAAEEGTRWIAATAHQNEHWSEVTPQRIRTATQELARQLQANDIPLSVVPSAEVMVWPDIEISWKSGSLLSIADRGQYLLIEMPHELYVDLRSLCASLHEFGLRPILAHPERVPELLHEPGAIEQLIAKGCLVQVSAHSITQPSSSADERALKSWFKRGVVHLLGSDGHSPRRRPPRLKSAYDIIARWAGVAMADRVGSTHGLAVLHGLPLRIPKPDRPSMRWFADLLPNWSH